MQVLRTVQNLRMGIPILIWLRFSGSESGWEYQRWFLQWPAARKLRCPGGEGRSSPCLVLHGVGDGNTSGTMDSSPTVWWAL